jgi:hypothetical protein
MSLTLVRPPFLRANDQRNPRNGAISPFTSAIARPEFAETTADPPNSRVRTGRACRRHADQTSAGEAGAGPPVRGAPRPSLGGGRGQNLCGPREGAAPAGLNGLADTDTRRVPRGEAHPGQRRPSGIQTSKANIELRIPPHSRCSRRPDPAAPHTHTSSFPWTFVSKVNADRSRARIRRRARAWSARCVAARRRLRTRPRWPRGASARQAGGRPWRCGS